MERLKILDNTLIVFIGDHGFHLGDHGMWGKSTLFEESCKSPLIVCGPGVSSSACMRTVEFLDIYPTLVDLCGLPSPGTLQGASLRPLLGNPTAPWDRPAYTSLRHDRTYDIDNKASNKVRIGGRGVFSYIRRQIVRIEVSNRGICSGRVKY